MKKLYLKALGFLCFSLSALNMSAQTTYYVKTDGTGVAATATSWGNASSDLQDVINTAQSGDKIFVKMGTYLPNRPANTPAVIDAANKDNAFLLKDGVSIYGGFSGTEANETQRVAGNLTILSGDLSGNDVDETTANAANYMTLNKTDNAYHVVIAVGITTSTVLDGFTITKGDASTNSTLTVNSKTIDRRLGGGIYILECGANFKISNVIATINRANGDGDTLGGGGSGFYINNSSPTIENCEIKKNYNMNSAPKTAGFNYGSGMSMVMASSPAIRNTTFSENFSGYGGAVSLNGGSPSFTNCTFKVNRGNSRGGAIDVRGSSPVFTSCLFSENNALGSGGGAVYNYTGRATFVNCIFYKNTAATTNGGAYGSQNASNHGAVFINNTFYENRNTYGGAATNFSAGIYVSAVGSSSSFPEKKTFLYNNIFFGNTATNNTTTPDIYTTASTLFGAFNNNIVQQTESVPADQNNQTNTDPLFISTTSGQLSFLAPKSNSPAKDMGNDTYNNTTVDFNGLARKNGTIDIGAVEYHSVLPVSLISFTAKATSGGAQLNWKVVSETSHKQYLLSRSADGRNYELIAKVAGAAELLNYSYTDAIAASGTYFYKLEQEDLDGKLNYLATQVLKTGLSTNNISFFPNPTRSNLTIALSAGVYNKYSVVNLQGSTILTGSINSSIEQISLNLSDLASGTYIVRLSGSNEITSARIIKL